MCEPKIVEKKFPLFPPFLSFVSLFPFSFFSVFPSYFHFLSTYLPFSPFPINFFRFHLLFRLFPFLSVTFLPFHFLHFFPFKAHIWKMKYEKYTGCSKQLYNRAISCWGNNFRSILTIKVSLDFPYFSNFRFFTSHFH